MSLKHGVRLRGLTPEMGLGVTIIYDVLRKMGVDCIITSVCDSKHGTGSLHYQGNAIDLRTRHVPVDVAKTMRDNIAKAIGIEFDVILEADHIHVEWQPHDG